ncbi:MAG TPA: glycoside hydrolase family 3 protein [Sphingobacteriaceae bacterium]
MKAKSGVILSLLLVAAGFSAGAQTQKPFIETLQEENAWVDSVFKKLNRRQRIAQLFMVRAHTNLGQKYADSVGRVIKKEKLGGVVFFQGGPGRQAAVTNQYQELAKTPLLVAMDAEWGLGMRLDSTMSYPYQMTLGAIQDNKLIYEMGRQIAKDFKRLGMQVNFAPVMDVNNNPKNPVINYRSFGDNKYKVAEKGAAYMKGLHDEGVLVTLKHFPGHGDTDVDSHYDLPQLKFTRERLDSLEMYPFKEVIAEGASGIMIAHMNIPALDPTPKLPSTLSKPIVTDILRNDLNYKGLIFSDAMDMKGVTKYFKDGEAEIRGLEAGMDVLELSENSKLAVKKIRKAIRQKRLSWDRINASVKKVLAAKYWTGLNDLESVSSANILSDLSRPEARVLNQQLADAAVTVLNSDSLISGFDRSKKTALVAIGTPQIMPFQTHLQTHFTNSLPFLIDKKAAPADIERLLNDLEQYEQIIVGVFDTRKRPGGTLDYSNDVKLLIPQLAKMNSIISVFANPYTIAGLPGIEQAKTLLVNYQNSEQLQFSAFKVIKGEIKATGKLPVTINAFFKNGDGLN